MTRRRRNARRITSAVVPLTADSNCHRCGCWLREGDDARVNTRDPGTGPVYCPERCEIDHESYPMDEHTQQAHQHTDTQAYEVGCTA